MPNPNLPSLPELEEAKIQLLNAAKEESDLAACLVRLNHNQRLSGNDYRRLTIALQHLLVTLEIRKIEDDLFAE